MHEGSARIPAFGGKTPVVSSTAGHIIREYRNILVAKSMREGRAVARRHVSFRAAASGGEPVMIGSPILSHACWAASSVALKQCNRLYLNMIHR
jgi:hypothetical protein